MSLTLIHTSDWHLGHALYERTREAEHQAFLDWLIGQLEAEAADALLITGDVYDVTNPPSSAMAALYRFLARASARCPRLQVFVIAGNHDSPGRIDAPAPLLAWHRVEVVGAFEASQPERVVFPVRDRDGRVGAWLSAVPFLRPADLPALSEEELAGRDPLIEGVREAYRRALDVARARRERGQALLAMGHCYMVGTQPSELSERRILGGNQHALPADIFPEDLAYAALGHLHRPQRVGQQERIRYAGSPIPLSLDERGYHHRILRIQLDGEALVETRSIPIPRLVPLLRIPDARGDALPLPELLERLRALPAWEGSRPDEWQRPFLEVGVRLDAPAPGLRARLEEALEGRAARLCSVRAAHTARPDRPLAEKTLGDLLPEDVFQARWRRDFPGSDPPADLLALFLDLLGQAQHEDAS